MQNTGWPGPCRSVSFAYHIVSYFSKKTTIYLDFLKEKKKAFSWLATSQNLPGVQARHRFFYSLYHISQK